MKLLPIENKISGTINGMGLENNAKNVASERQSGFIEYLDEALGKVDELQKEASSNAMQMALGDQNYLHNTMISFEKANLALQLTIEIRNKIVEAYQEIMRIQM